MIFNNFNLEKKMEQHFKAELVKKLAKTGYCYIPGIGAMEYDKEKGKEHLEVVDFYFDKNFLEELQKEAKLCDD